MTNTGNSSNIAPSIINIFSNPTTGASAPLIVTFSAVIQDPDDELNELKYVWDFGDGTTSNERLPAHRYTWQGTFDYSLTVTDRAGASDTLTSSGAFHELTIIGGNHRPVITTCTATPPTTNSGISITFTGVATDEDGDALTYLWNFGDGTTLNGSTVSHAYARGIYYPKLTVTDAQGAFITRAIEGGVGIDVNLPPVITSFICSPNSNYEAPVSVNFSCTAYDKEGQIITYIWQIENKEGDGYTTQSDTFYGQSVNFQYNIGGNFNVILTVVDSEGEASTSRNYLIIKDDIE